MRIMHSLCLVISLIANAFAQESDASLPPRVKVVWDIEKSFREKTTTQERVCLNGLWRWQPVKDAGNEVPAQNWGFFKVPGCWPGIGDYMQTDSQTLFPHPAWKNEKLADVTSAWYQREIAIPAEWTGRRISLSTEYINSFAAV